MTIQEFRSPKGSRRPLFLGLVAAAAVGSGLVYWYAGGQESDDTRRAAADAMGAAQARFAAAVEQRERAQASVDDAVLERTQDLGGRIDRLRRVAGNAAPAVVAGTPTTPDAKSESASRPQWDMAATTSQLDHLIQAREESLRRGAVSSYRYEAEASWEFEHLQKGIRLLGLADDSIPQNEFKLLKVDTLKSLRQSWTDYQAHYQKAAAAAPPDTFARPLALAAEKLTRINAALDAPHVDLKAVYSRTSPHPVSAADFAAWAERADSARDGEIATREHQLLKKALAVDGSDIAARQRFADLGPADGVAERAALARAGLVLERARGFSPATARSGQVKDLLASRFSDPVRATECEALLSIQFTELQQIADPAVRAKVLPEPLAGSVLDWMVSQLTDGDLAEARARHVEAIRRLDMIDVANPTDADKKCVEYDRVVIRAEGDALDREVDFRRANGRSRSAAYNSADLDAATREVIEGHAAARVALLAQTEEGRQALWEAQRRYAARAAVPNPEVFASLTGLHLSGLEAEVARLEADSGRLAQLDRDQGGSGPDVYRQERDAAADVLRQRLARLRSGIADLDASTSQSERARSLADRLSKVEAAVTPFDSKKSAQPVDRVLFVELPPDMGNWPQPPDGSGKPPPDDPAAGQAVLNPKPKNPGGGSGAANANEVRSTSYMKNRGIARVSPFGDADLRAFEIGFRERFHGAMAALRPSVNDLNQIRSPEDGPRPAKAYVSLDDATLHMPREAKTEARPELKGWRIKEKVGTEVVERKVEFEKINSLKSFRVMPGGVALGTEAAVPGDWSKAGLIYAGRQRRFILVQSDGRRIRLPTVDPAVLKACVLFVQSEDPVAVSIGRGAGDVGPSGGGSSRVLLHPDFRDTPVGLDLIDADRLPWSLRNEWLPNGARNVAREKMQSLVNAASKVPDEVVAAVSSRVSAMNLDEISPGKDSKRARQLCQEAVNRVTRSKSRSLVAIAAQAIWEGDPTPGARAEKVFEILRKQNLGLDNESEVKNDLRKDFDGLSKDRVDALSSWLLSLVAFNDDLVSWDVLAAASLAFAARDDGKDSALRVVVPKIVDLLQSDLSVLTDRSVVFRQVGGDDLTYDTHMQIRYVHNRIKIESDGLRRLDDVVAHDEASRTATDLYPTLEDSFPSLRRAREYATWIAFIRWALKDRHVAWVDLSDLKDVRYRTTRTPDFLVRGGQKSREAALKKYGLLPVGQ